MTRHETNPLPSPEVSVLGGLLQFPHTLMLQKKTAPTARDANHSVPPGESLTPTRRPRPRIGGRACRINDEAQATGMAARALAF